MNLKKTASALAIITGLSVGGVELEQASQLSKIHAKEKVSYELVVATTSLSKSHKQNVRMALVEEFENDKVVAPTNYRLHVNMFIDHYEELAESNSLPEWLDNPMALTNTEKIEKVHTSLKANNDAT